MKKLLIILILPVMLSACASMPPLNFSVPNVGPSQRKINAELKSTTVTVGRPDEKTGDLPPVTTAITPLWKESLQEALDRMAIFQDDAGKKVSLSVKILSLDLPAGGVTMETSTTARYELLDRNTGAILYSETISSTGSVPFNHAFMGSTRAMEALNRTVQNNIAKFLMALETVNVNKPLFPGRKK